MKIELVNGSVINVLKNVDATRGKSAENILWLIDEESSENDETE